MENYDLFVITFLDKIFETFYLAIGKSGMDTKESSKWLYSNKAKEFMTQGGVHMWPFNRDLYYTKYMLDKIKYFKSLSNAYTCHITTPMKVAYVI